ncbi:MAG TPA: aminopeptidase N [Jatrophihabitans sp.]|nr:aminopeptidase N [Jatrophihabitans sp.]
MQTPNLTKQDAALRSSLLSDISYDVVLDLTDADGGPAMRTFRSRTTITFDATRPGASTFIDVIAERLHEVSLNSQPIEVGDYTPEDGIVLPELAEHNVLVIDGDLLFTTIGQGLHSFVDPIDDEVYLYSQFETTDAKRVYACFDQPDLKARFTLHVTAPAHWQLISNSPIGQVEDDDETKTVHFETTPPISPYLTALVAGPYFRASDHHDGIDLGLYCRRSLAEHLDTDELFTVTKQGFDWYHENFGYRYAFTKYDQLFVPEFNAGAMENAGCVTILEDYVFRSRVTAARYERRALTVLHELAHMWFGDLVTMRWFDDLWLNESFAEWAATLAQSQATQWANAWTTFGNTEKTWAYRQDQLPSTHPIACDIPDAEAVEVNFDGITYAKGASVLKQLAAYVGLPEFLAGTRQYFADNAFGNTTLTDLLDALKASSGRELADWADLWLKTSGLNTLSADYTVDEAGNFTSFDLVQDAPTGNAADNVLRPHRIAIGLYNYGSAFADGSDRTALVRTHQVELDISGVRTAVPELVGHSRPDLVLVNDDDLTYCKLRLDPHSLATIRDGGLAAMTDSLARTLCWSSSWDMVRDGELATRHYLQLAIANAPLESDVGVVQSVFRQVMQALGSFADPDWAATGRAEFAEAAIGAARAAAPGSDHQFAWVHAAILAASTEEQLDFLADLLSDRPSLDGLVVDTDLRWALLHALVASGRAGAPEIAEQAAADRSAAGERAAATARALVPTAAAKEAAWTGAVTDVTLSNGLMRANMAGLKHPLADRLLAPYVARYFEQAAEIWQRRTPETARDLLVGLFPNWSSAINAETIALADEFLADPGHPASLRRLVSEGRSELVRAMTARAADIAAD